MAEKFKKEDGFLVIETPVNETKTERFTREQILENIDNWEKALVNIQGQIDYWKKLLDQADTLQVP